MRRQPANVVQQITNALLAEKLEQLHTTTVAGFASMEQRQDTTNGKVLKAGDDITGLRSQHEALKAEFAYNRIIWYMLTVCISVIIALASYILLSK